MRACRLLAQRAADLDVAVVEVNLRCPQHHTADQQVEGSWLEAVESFSQRIKGCRCRVGKLVNKMGVLLWV
jgi:hypothetical protein